MPYGYGSANKGSSGGSKGSPHSGGGGGGWSPGAGGKQHQPKKKTGGWSPGVGGQQHIPKKKTSTWSPGVGGQQHIPKKKTTTVTAGLGHPAFKNRGIRTNLKKRSLANERLSKLSRFITQQPRYIPWGLNTYTQGSTPGMAKIWAGTEGAAPSIYTATRTKGLGNLDDLWKSITGKIPLGKYNLPTGSEGVHVATKPGVAAGYATKATAPFRGWDKMVTKTGEVLSGEIPTRFLNQSRNMWGQKQAIIPAEVANKALLGKNINLSNVKNLAKPISKFMTRAVPVAGGAISAADAAYRASQGDWLGSALSAGSAVPGWGLVPLAAQVGTDWLGLTGSKRTNQANGGLIDFYRYGGFI
jgi:hypothetical protein